MIVKYYNNGVWGYIDNVHQVANADIDPIELTKRYDEEVRSGDREDVASYISFTQFGNEICVFEPKEKEPCIPTAVRLPEDIIAVNKVFMKAVEGLPEEVRDNPWHAENLLNSKILAENCPVNMIVLYLNEHKEYDTVVMVTNQKCYLMNDKGQTIERLI